METWRKIVLYGMSISGVLALLMLIAVAQMNRTLQAELGRQEEILSKGQMNTQVGNSLLRDMAMAAGRNAAMRDLLTRSGYPPPAIEPGAEGEREPAPGPRKGGGK